MESARDGVIPRLEIVFRIVRAAMVPLVRAIRIFHNGFADVYNPSFPCDFLFDAISHSSKQGELNKGSFPMGNDRAMRPFLSLCCKD